MQKEEKEFIFEDFFHDITVEVIDEKEIHEIDEEEENAENQILIENPEDETVYNMIMEIYNGNVQEIYHEIYNFMDQCIDENNFTFFFQILTFLFKNNIKIYVNKNILDFCLHVISEDSFVRVPCYSLLFDHSYIPDMDRFYSLFHDILINSDQPFDFANIIFNLTNKILTITKQYLNFIVSDFYIDIYELQKQNKLSYKNIYEFTIISIKQLSYLKFKSFPLYLNLLEIGIMDFIVSIMEAGEKSVLNEVRDILLSIQDQKIIKIDDNCFERIDDYIN